MDDETRREAVDALHLAETARADLLARTGRDEKVGMQVDGIVSGIDRVACQLRILALNASIKAAPAGDAGRASAIACEVRKLAEDARGATARALDLLV